MKKYLVEFIGTFFLIFTIGMTVLRPDGAGELAPFAIAGVLIAVIYAGGHVSGAHYNPAVTFAVWLRGRCAAKDVAPYLVAQVAAAVVATLCVKALKTGFLSRAATLAGPLSPEILPALLAEFVFTFALVFVILNVATARGTSGNSFYGAAIGLTVLAGALTVGPVSGAVFNPAVAIGACAMGILSWGSLWLYFIAQFAAGYVAVKAFRVVQPQD